MRLQPSPLDDLGLLTLTALAEQTGVPRKTLVSWIRAEHMVTARVDGVFRSTVAEVHRVAETIRRGKHRTWELEPLEVEEYEPISQT